MLQSFPFMKSIQRWRGKTFELKSFVERNRITFLLLLLDDDDDMDISVRCRTIIGRFRSSSGGFWNQKSIFLNKIYS